MGMRCGDDSYFQNRSEDRGVLEERRRWIAESRDSSARLGADSAASIDAAAASSAFRATSSWPTASPARVTGAD